MNQEPKSLWAELVENLPLKEANNVGLKTSINDCIEIMQQKNDSYVIATSQSGDIQGVFSDKDLMHSYIGTNLSGDTEISAVMTRLPITFNKGANLKDALQIMGNKRISHLPIVDGQKIIGILGLSQLLDYISECFPADLLNIPSGQDLRQTLKLNGG